MSDTLFTDLQAIRAGLRAREKKKRLAQLIPNLEHQRHLREHITTLYRSCVEFRIRASKEGVEEYHEARIGDAMSLEAFMRFCYSFECLCDICK